MRRKQERDAFSVDANGLPTERIVVGGQDVVIHYAELPDSDLTTVEGIPCTTALRTVIDIASGISTAELERIVQDCLERRLFSREEAMARIAELDMLTHPGAELLRQAIA